MKREQLTNVTTESIDDRCAEFAEHGRRFACAIVLTRDHRCYGYRAMSKAIRRDADRIIALRSQQVTP